MQSPVAATYSILVVDDDERTRLWLGRVLKAEGHVSILAANAQEALKLFEKHVFDVVLTDFSMPGLNGVELSACIKHKNPAQRILIMAGEGDIANGISIPWVGGFLEKPFTMELLRKRLGESMELRAGTDGR